MRATSQTNRVVKVNSEVNQHSRRQLLQLGSAGLMGLSLPSLLAAESATNSHSARADSLIIIFLNGGPSHLDMWDMKPDGPSDSRGQFKPIDPSLPSVQLSEHLPKLAKQMHHCSLVRSMHHSVNNSHAAAVYVSMTGHDRGEQGGGFQPTDNPSPGALAAQLRPTAPEVAPHVTMPYQTLEGATGPPQPGFFGGWLGRGYDPLWILKDPNADNFSVPEFSLEPDIPTTRLTNRNALLSNLNLQLRGESAAPLQAMNRFQKQAADILTSQSTQAAFRIGQEPSVMRDAYGRNIYGQSVLLARRLIEAGTRVVTVSWAPDANATWDTHSGNFSKLRDTLLPEFDAASSALLGDLDQRGMLDRTLVAVLGDFGRTPKINANNAGRDHWNYCYTVMLAGGGIKPGFVYGASDKQGAFPADRPTIPADIIATIYHQLGIDHRRELKDRFGRPHRIIPTGSAVHELLV